MSGQVIIQSFLRENRGLTNLSGFLKNIPMIISGSMATDLKLLETAITGSGFTPVFLDLTRKDLNIPVVRAIVPGLEFMTDFDRFSRVSRRLFANYLGLLYSEQAK